MAFLGWYDPDKRKTAAAKVTEAIERYVEKFGSAPSLCLTSATDASELTGKTTLTVRAVSYIEKNLFYIGVEEKQDVELD